MNEEEKKVFTDTLNSFISETRRNFSQLHEDNDLRNKRLDEIYIALSQLKAESHTLIDVTEKQVKSLKKEHTETRNMVLGSVEKLEEDLQGKTRFIVRETQKGKSWIKRLFRRG